MNTIYNALKMYGYKIGQVASFSVKIDSNTGLLELLAHIRPTKKDIGKQLVVIEAHNTNDNYHKLHSLALEAEHCAALNK